MFQRLMTVIAAPITAELVRASHRYREVTGSNPVQVLNFSGFSTQLLKLVHNCEDHNLINYLSITFLLCDGEIARKCLAVRFLVTFLLRLGTGFLIPLQKY